MFRHRSHRDNHIRIRLVNLVDALQHSLLCVPQGNQPHSHRATLANNPALVRRGSQANSHLRNLAQYLRLNHHEIHRCSLRSSRLRHRVVDQVAFRREFHLNVHLVVRQISRHVSQHLCRRWIRRLCQAVNQVVVHLDCRRVNQAYVHLGSHQISHQGYRLINRVSVRYLFLARSHRGFRQDNQRGSHLSSRICVLVCNRHLNHL